MSLFSFALLGLVSANSGQGGVVSGHALALLTASTDHHAFEAEQEAGIVRVTVAPGSTTTPWPKEENVVTDLAHDDAVAGKTGDDSPASGAVVFSTLCAAGVLALVA